MKQDEPGNQLLFLIDITGSMSSWISALNTTLPSTLRSMSLTRAFDSLAVMSYTDYDQPVDNICAFSGFLDSKDVAAVTKLQAFAANLRPTGETSVILF